MAHWDDPAFVIRLETINMNMIFLLLGLYGWEYFSSFDVEYAVIRGRLAFRWPLIPYLLGRLCQFVFLVLVALRTNPPTEEYKCLPGAVSTALIGDIALGCASTNLMIRTWVIWRDSHFVHYMLLVFALGHWIILALDVANLRQLWLEGGCAILVVHPIVNAIVLVYSLCYDFLVLVLSVIGLSRQKPKSQLRKRLRAQGLSYFVVAVVFYIPPTVFSFLGVTFVVSMTALSAVTASTIVSSRAVRLLLGLRTPQSSSSISDVSVDRGVALTSQIPEQMTVPTSVP